MDGDASDPVGAEPGFAVGDLVEVRALKGARELNGRWGRIAAFVQATSRYGVKLDGLEEPKSLNPANLHRAVVSAQIGGTMPAEFMESLPGTPIFKTVSLLLGADTLLALECCAAGLQRELRAASETWEQALVTVFGGTFARARRRFPDAEHPRAAFAALAKLRQRMHTVEVVRGDLREAASLGVDAVVCPANWSLEPRGPAAKAVFDQAGPELEEYIAEMPRPIQAGEVCWTPGFGLGVAGIIHAVGPDRSTADGDGRLRQTYARALAKVVEHGHRSVAVGSISTGGNGFKIGLSARVAAEEIREALTQTDAASPLRVVVVAFEAEVEDVFRGALDRIHRRANEDLLEMLPLLILDSMLPGQRLCFDVNTLPVAVRTGCDRFAMVGMTRGLGGMAVVPCGVEVHVRSRTEVGAATELEVVASGRRFALPGSPQREESPPDEQGRHHFSASVVWSEAGEGEPPTPEDMNASNALEPLITQWLALVRAGHERQPGQMAAVLQDLGPMPPAGEASRRALWVCALINPLPGLGVAWEIRPRALMADSAAKRLDAATEGIRASIAHLDGSRPMR